MTLPVVATFWQGRPLSWIEKLSLTSFVAMGHEVKIYSYGEVEGVPDGVSHADAHSIFEPSEYLRENAGASMIADVFRLHLMQITDEVWVDSDMIACKPLTLDGDGYALGYERPGQSICNAVLRAPRQSPAIKMIVDFINNPHPKPRWLRPGLRAKLNGVPPEQILSRLYQIKRSSMGPMALGHALRETGEVSHVRPREAYFSVPWQFVDVFFNPYGGAEGWMSDDTEAVHLWAYALSGYHKTHKPHPESFIGAMVARHEVDVSHLKVQ
ncbi:MAG: hypothetical protein AAGI10_10280 [Pseudomonadota bacterium]